MDSVSVRTASISGSSNVISVPAAMSDPLTDAVQESCPGVVGGVGVGVGDGVGGGGAGLLASRLTIQMKPPTLFKQSLKLTFGPSNRIIDVETEPSSVTRPWHAPVPPRISAMIVAVPLKRVLPFASSVNVPVMSPRHALKPGPALPAPSVNIQDHAQRDRSDQASPRRGRTRVCLAVEARACRSTLRRLARLSVRARARAQAVAALVRVPVPEQERAEALVPSAIHWSYCLRTRARARQHRRAL